MIDYDPHDWWFHFFAVRGSMLAELWTRLLLCAVAAVAVVLVNRLGYPVAVAATAHTLVGVALGLLLVFRTNASYDRFWEGRRLWGGMVNAARNLVRQGVTLYGEDALCNELKTVARAFAPACMRALRGAGEQQGPLAVAVRMSQAVKAARDKGLLSDIQQMELDRNIGLLVDHFGACERIHKTPLPFAYVVHLRRAIVLYCVTLPFALVQPMGAWSILAVVLIAFVLFGIEEIGVEIEDPFGTDANDLPLERICETIDRNLAAM